MPVVLHTTHMIVAVVVSRTSQEEHTGDTDNYIECTEQEEHTEDTVVDTVVVHTVEDNNQRLEAFRKDIDWVSKSERYTSDSNIVVVAVAAAVGQLMIPIHLHWSTLILTISLSSRCISLFLLLLRRFYRRPSRRRRVLHLIQKNE